MNITGIIPLPELFSPTDRSRKRGVMDQGGMKER
jgi:hypothetical protein